MNAPLVSVCVFCYNHAQFIEETLTSVVTQEYRPIQIVIADDGSTDGTYEIAERFAERHSDLVRLLPRKINVGIRGLVANQNRALAACEGKYIAFIDGDDLYLPGKIAKQVQWLEKDDSRVLCGHDVEAFESETGRHLYLWSERFGLPSGRGPRGVIRNKVPFSTVATMVRRSAVPARGFDDRLQWLVDWKMWIDCVLSGGSYGSVEGILGRYRRHSNNWSRSEAPAGLEDWLTTLALLEAEHPCWAGDCQASRAGIFYSQGVTSLLKADSQLARQHFRNAVRQQPAFAWKAGIGWGLSFMSQKFVRRMLYRADYSAT